MPQPFHPFTQEHFVALGIGMAAAAAFLIAGKRGGIEHPEHLGAHRVRWGKSMEDSLDVKLRVFVADAENGPADGLDLGGGEQARGIVDFTLDPRDGAEEIAGSYSWVRY